MYLYITLLGGQMFGFFAYMGQQNVLQFPKQQNKLDMDRNHILQQEPRTKK